MKKINNYKEVKVGDWIACFNSPDDDNEDYVASVINKVEEDERKNIINLNKGDIIIIMIGC